NLVLVGIKTRGVPIAKRLQEKIAQIEQITVPIGELDITLYRDDLQAKSTAPTLIATNIDVDIQDKTIVVVDDVLYVGRTVRAILDAVIDISQPSQIQLIVRIDRLDRVLAIRVDYVGKNIPTSKEVVISVGIT